MGGTSFVMTDVTVWIRSGFFAGRFELINESLPLGVAGGQAVLERVSADDMAESTMYPLSYRSEPKCTVRKKKEN